MTAAAPLGLPQRRPAADKVTSYPFVPALKDLLRTAGVPGVGYAQVCLHNLRNVLADKAADWAQAGGVGVYTIKGPRGEAEVMLLCVGAPIYGQDPHSGSRICWYDEDIAKATGYDTPKEYTTSFKQAKAANLFSTQPVYAHTEALDGLPTTSLADVVAAAEADGTIRPVGGD